ncbi:bifunctional anthranilate synthase component II/anthranilate phosphoribosyltransferase [Spirochaeta cellobiosiphila]|uniref:bifunctional anthranilate synthase component II/anthranilate phosphoribosyltransferase n=1 Tax=Spirochaeta cellobiosiphila TaxID=504483 RepID=UPI000426EF70|nr:bifunctional anthranilate synthase component II/anthranilate phosphoribosyltransferase [Spirochaeta cellobiosiphila]
MIVLLDNYDSFTYNVYQYLTEVTELPIKVIRNDQIDLTHLIELKPSYLVISPGPGRPTDAGISIEAIKYFAGKIPILGICLGHQAIGEAFGGIIVGAKNIVHGKTEPITNDGRGLFRGLSNPTQFTRYHSLVIEKNSLPQDFEITAQSQDGEIMGLRHKNMIIEGVQFHPESIASEAGKRMLKNFLNYKREALDIKELLSKVINGEDLSQDEAASFMEELTDGNLSDIHISAFLVALNAKGITSEEIAGCASVLLKKRVAICGEKPLLDTCGTGGSGSGSFNISSFAALIASSAGAAVAKHGNRAVSSLSGSADFYKCLGMTIDIDPVKSEKLLKETDFAFLFAPLFHGAMKYAGPVRKALGIKTIMNCLGPLSNPAGAQYQIIGVYSSDLVPIVARAAKLLGVKRVMTVYGEDGLDEISISAATQICFIDESGVETNYSFDPASLGLNGYTLGDIKGGSGQENANMALDILNGKGKEALIDAICVNAGAALMVYGLVESISEGYTRSKEILKSGLVKDKLNLIVSRGKELALQ